MNEETIQLGNGILSQIEGPNAELTNTHFTIEQLVNEINNITSIPAEREGSNAESFPLSEEEAQILEQAVEEAHQEIPVNSDTLLIDDTTSRFSSAIWYEKIQEKLIVLAGVGGIGRFGNLINF